MSDDRMLDIQFTLNGERISARIDEGERLLDLLRYGRGLTGTKEGCGEGECGACTVLLGGLPVNSCLVPAWQAGGREIETVEAVPEAEDRDGRGGARGRAVVATRERRHAVRCLHPRGRHDRVVGSAQP